MGDRKRMTGRPVVRAEAEEEIEGVGDSCKQLWGSKAHREGSLGVRSHRKQLVLNSKCNRKPQF